MSKPRHKWYGNVIRTIRYYPTLEAEKGALTSQSITAGYSGMPRASEPSRATEACALRCLSPREEEEIDAVRGAIIEISRQQDGDDVLKIVKMVDWKKTHTIDGAAGVIPVSPRTAKRMRGRFVLAVARRLRYI